MSSGELSDTISSKQLLALVRRNFATILFSLIFGVSAALALASVLPPKYKSKAILSIQSSYFRHPLVSDLVSEVQDPSEMSAQRLSLLRLALNDKFLDELGAKYNIYRYSERSALRAIDRELFLKEIEYFSVSPSSFQVSISSTIPEDAHSIVTAVLDQMTYTLTEQRFQTLLKARDAILTQANALNTALTDLGSSPQILALQEQLATMEANLAELRVRFTESHPAVAEMKSKSRALRTRIGSVPPPLAATGNDYTNIFLSPASRASTQQIFDDLLKKLNHLNIVLEMERDRKSVSYLSIIEQPGVPIHAFFPNFLQFALFGLLGGALLAVIRISFLEARRMNVLSPEDVPSLFNLELLGDLPPLLDRRAHLLLGPSNDRMTALPSPGKT